MGIARDGSHKSDYQPGLELHAKYTFFAEGARGSLTKQLKANFELEANCQPQVYGIGLKELWDIEPARPRPGPRSCIRKDGRSTTPGRLWRLVSCITRRTIRSRSAIVVCAGLSEIRILSPFEEFQRWKHHPAIAAILKGGKRVSYGARAINEGGWQSTPQACLSRAAR